MVIQSKNKNKEPQHHKPSYNQQSPKAIGVIREKDSLTTKLEKLA
jgi:hypothetical protein